MTHQSDTPAPRTSPQPEIASKDVQHPRYVDCDEHGTSLLVRVSRQARTAIRLIGTVFGPSRRECDSACTHVEMPKGGGRFPYFESGETEELLASLAAHQKERNR